MKEFSATLRRCRRCLSERRAEMLDIEDRHGVAVLRMRRLGVNRLDVELLRRITAAFEFVGKSCGVVLTGYGSTFAIDAKGPHTDDLALAQHAALTAVRAHQGPVIAAVNGDALDAGFELATAADIRLMARGVIGKPRSAPRQPQHLRRTGEDVITVLIRPTPLRWRVLALVRDGHITHQSPGRPTQAMPRAS